MMRLDELAKRLGCILEGDGATPIHGIAALADAGPGDLSLAFDPHLASAVAATRASALLCGPQSIATTRLSTIRSTAPELALADAISILRPPWRPAPGIHPTASIHPTAHLGSNCHVGAFVAVGERCRVGADAVLHPHVVLYPQVEVGDRFTAHAHVVVREGSRIGDDVTLQPGAVIGGDGFGFTRRSDGSHAKIAQVGIVSLANRVEIQANSCVDRATLGVSRIGAGTKIDNLTQIAHNCEIGENVILCAQVGLAGSTRVGDNAILAGQVGVAGHCKVGEGTIVTAQSGTHGDLEPGKMYSGSPAFDHVEWLRSTAVFARLSALQRDVRELRNRLLPRSPGSR